MYSVPDLSVIIPAYNESATIKDILLRVDEVRISKEIIVVDDRSTDGTRDILLEIERSWSSKPYSSSLVVVLQPVNKGKGSALRAGIARARGKVIIVQDADLEYDPQDYPKIVEPILNGTADAVYGSRWLNAPIRARLGWHFLGNRLLTAASNALTGLCLTDMETCYKAIRRELLQSFALKENRFGFEPEVTAHLARCGAVIHEVPISYSSRSYQEGKKIGWRDGVEAFRVIAQSHLDVRCGFVKGN